jgi:hypothetical protein
VNLPATRNDTLPAEDSNLQNYTDTNTMKNPFVSKVSCFNAQKKKECIDLENHHQTLKDDIKKLTHKNKIIDELGQ